MRHLIISFTLCMTLLSCSTLNPLYSVSSDYKSHIQQNLVKKRVYDRGRMMVAADILPVTDELVAEQEKYVPGFAFKKENDKTQVIVGLSLSTAEVFSKSSIKFFLNNTQAVYVREEAQKPLLETLYYFAHPFNRVFFVDFPKTDGIEQAELKIQTPQGTVATKIQL